MRLLRFLPILLALVIAALVPLTSPSASASRPTTGPGRRGGGYAQHALRAGLTDQDFYFVMGDRFANGDTANDDGGLSGDPNVTGFDPTSKGFYNGGDLKGLRSKLDYIQGLGTDAIWLTPIFKNKAVQLEDGPSAGYHGYWITDFTQVDPHLGTNADLTDLVEAAHAKGMKVFFDIITNHTADVIGYERGRPDGVRLQGRRRPTATRRATPSTTATSPAPTSSPRSTRPRRSPTCPCWTPDEEDLKVPAWLNDATNYHNRGNTTFTGEDSQYGDFFGLDDLFTEQPEVVDGMTDIYSTWVEDFGIDGFRIDTMKHVNDEFWQQFGPALQQVAADRTATPTSSCSARSPSTAATLPRRPSPPTTRPTTACRRSSTSPSRTRPAASPRRASATAAARDGSSSNDDWYTDADSNAYALPTFLGNHDMGRFGYFLKTDNPGRPTRRRAARPRPARPTSSCTSPAATRSSTTATSRASPAPAATSSPGRRCSPARSPEYQDDDQIGTDRTGADDNFVTDPPALPRDQPPRRRSPTGTRRCATAPSRCALASGRPGVFAFSRIDRKRQREYVVALNNSEQTEVGADADVRLRKGRFRRVYGAGPARLRDRPARPAHRHDVPGLSTGRLRVA